MRWHIISPEYPPQLGGVSDYSFQLAAGLAGQGDDVHVWCPNPARAVRDEDRAWNTPGVTVHREFLSFESAGLVRAGRELDRFPAPRHILAQWVPHGYGRRSMNIGFCWWLWKRARLGDNIELVVHEPFLTFSASSLRQNIPALVHRCMIILLLQAAARVWVTIPRWERMLRPYTLGRTIVFQWLPIFSNVPEAADPLRIHAVRQRYAAPGRLLIGHFGTYGNAIGRLLGPILTSLASDPVEQTILLMGERSEEYRRELLQQHPWMETRVLATGQLTLEELSYHLSACDLLVQPYPDGVSTRRGSFMAGLGNGGAIVTTAGWLTEPFWSQSGAVALTPAGDTETFVAQVRRIREENTERRRLGLAARKLYQDRFQIDHTVSTLRQTHTETAQERECAFSSQHPTAS